MSDISADIVSSSCPVYEMKTPIKQGAMDRSFLLDTVRHISSYLEFGNKETSNRIIYPVEVYK
jgi:hypothetical protein